MGKAGEDTLSHAKGVNKNFGIRKSSRRLFSLTGEINFPSPNRLIGVSQPQSVGQGLKCVD